MPQQPASRSTTVEPGIFSSSAFAAGRSPIDFWWQWPCSRIFGGPCFRRSGSSRGVFFEQHAGIRHHACLPLVFAAQQRRSVFAHGRQTTWLAENDLLALRRGVVQSFVFRSACSRAFAQQAFRDQRPSAAVIRRERHADACAMRDVPRRHADLRIVEIGERVVEEQDTARLSGCLRSPHARRQRSPAQSRAACADDRCRRSPRSAAATASVPEIQFISGAMRLPRLRNRANVAEHLRVQRRSVRLPVAGQKLALEPRHIHADRAFRFARAAFQAKIEHLVNALDRQARPRPAARSWRAAGRWRARASCALLPSLPCTKGTSCRRASCGRRPGRCTFRPRRPCRRIRNNRKTCADWATHSPRRSAGSP